MKYLFVIAHPDDEALAGGATMHKLAAVGNEVAVCVLNSVSDIRCKDSERMMDEMKLSHKVLGVSKTYVGEFETMHFNVTPEQELVEFIENAIIKFEPDVVITHHPSDLHNDHHHVGLACTTAVRLPQRQVRTMNRIKEFLYMEVPSSTDWAVSNVQDSFIPNVYSEISNADFEAKIMSLEVYTEGAVLRQAPHPRSKEVLKAIAVKRGSEVGYYMAEAFQLVFKGEL